KVSEGRSIAGIPVQRIGNRQLLDYGARPAGKARNAIAVPVSQRLRNSPNVERNGIGDRKLVVGPACENLADLNLRRPENLAFIAPIEARIPGMKGGAAKARLEPPLKG